MPFEWTDKNLKWFMAASRYTGFHRELAASIVPLLPENSTLCDAGCGPGMIDIELAPHLGQLTAVDSNPLVLHSLAKQAVGWNISNIKTLCGDAYALQENYDFILMSFFGHGKGWLEAFLPHCNTALIRVVNQNRSGKLYPCVQGHRNRDTVQTLRQQLDEAGVCYQCQQKTLEFGQPLQTWQQAEQFVKSYAPLTSGKQIKAFLQHNLQKIEHPEYEYYLPNPKPVGIFTIYK